MTMRNFAHLGAFFAAIACLVLPNLGQGQGVPAQTVVKDLPYREGINEPGCKLDLYLPAQGTGFSVVVWFHGGGMTGGDKKGAAALGAWLAAHGIAMAAVDYRLSPAVKYPAYVEDAAQSVAWVRKHGPEYGIDPARLYVAGHSAGGYLAMMLAMAPAFLKEVGMTPDDLAGAISVSGEMITHFTVRAERGLDADTLVIDEAAPMYYTRKETPPLHFLIGDEDWPARREQNAYFAAALRAAGNKRVSFQVIPHRTHVSIYEKIPEPNDPTGTAFLAFLVAPAS